MIAAGAWPRVVFLLASAGLHLWLSSLFYFDWAWKTPVIDGGPLGFLTLDHPPPGRLAGLRRVVAGHDEAVGWPQARRLVGAPDARRLRALLRGGQMGSAAVRAAAAEARRWTSGR